MLPIMLPTPVVRRKNKYRCSVPGCSSIYYWPAQPNVKKKRFYRLPKDDNRRQQWIDILGIPNGPKSVHSMSVCGDHFGEEAFTNTLRDRLNKYAKPLVPAPLVSDNVEVDSYQQYVPNEFSENSEKIDYRIGVSGTAITFSELQKKTSEDKNKKLSCENKVYVYELPSGRKVMFYHLPILENLK